MASRSSGGMGVMIALVVFIMLSIALLLTSMLFYTKKEKALAQSRDDRAALEAYVRPGERERDDVKRLASLADAERQSVVAYQRDQMQDLMKILTGDSNETVDGFAARLSRVEGYEADRTSVMGLLTSFENALASEQALTATLREEKEEAERNQIAASEALASLQRAHDATVAAIQEDVGIYSSNVDRFSQDVQDSQTFMEERVNEIRAEYEDQIAELTRQIEEEEARIAQLTDANRALKQRINSVTTGGRTEADLVDGRVARVMDNDEVFIDLGRNQNVVLGMTFDVYGSTTEMRPDARGNVPSGKATLEVTRVDSTTSTARVIRSTIGQAVVEGDIIVNPFYDPDKKYTFFVFGLFDLDRENGPSELETDVVKARVTAWGGELQDEFSGDVDFVVLGQQPDVPTPLRPGATPAEVRAYVAQRKFYDEYIGYLEEAASLSIPVLNQNRLLTLIGYYR